MRTESCIALRATIDQNPAGSARGYTPERTPARQTRQWDPSTPAQGTAHRREPTRDKPSKATIRFNRSVPENAKQAFPAKGRATFEQLMLVSSVGGGKSRPPTASTLLAVAYAKLTPSHRFIDGATGSENKPGGPQVRPQDRGRTRRPTLARKRTNGRERPRQRKRAARVRPLRNNLPDDALLSQAYCPLSSAQRRFTVLFGMGRGGSTALLSSGMTCCPTTSRSSDQFGKKISSVFQ